MRDYVLSRAIALEEAGGWSIASLVRHWRARRSVGKLRDFDDHMLHDIGVQRADIEWAAGLPLSVNAALALEERGWQRRRGERAKRPG